jgi:hypothetical protein
MNKTTKYERKDKTTKYFYSRVDRWNWKGISQIAFCMEIDQKLKINILFTQKSTKNRSSKNTHNLFFRFTFLVFYFSDLYFVDKAYIVKEQYFQTLWKYCSFCNNVVIMLSTISRLVSSFNFFFYKIINGSTKNEIFRMIRNEPKKWRYF